MDISSIGASNIQALNLISLLGSSSSSSNSDDLLSLLGGQTDSVSLSAQGQWLSRAQESNPFKADFDNLGSLISSGDTEGAKAAYAAMQEKMQARQGADDPMASDFAAIGTALESGDADAAQAAWSALSEKLQSMPPPPPPPKNAADSNSSTSTSASTSSSDLEAMLISMYLQSGVFTSSTTKS